ncbi:MAG: formate dehydrogenase accessory sulfurtransferase FdhD [Cytophagaceae bacterium]|nr:formate dehydrogenase accessory sulfurtransferase FdhD [Cytophagaceae bacterium]
MLPVSPITVLKVSGDEVTEQPDLLAVEEPLEVRLGYGPASDRQQRSLSVTMRTPGHDEALVLGFLLTEGIINHPQQVRAIRHCQDTGRQQAQNVIRAELEPDVAVAWERLERHFYTSSSCGVCGKASIEAVYATSCAVLPPAQALFNPDLLHQLPQRLRLRQDVFSHTGGLHAAGLFDTDGQILLLSEDVGRHNALDKLIGAAALRGWLPLHRYGLLVSGRASFELVQKALMAGLPLLAAVGAPSSLAVDLARSAGQTLVGFLREGRFNVYCGAERLTLSVVSA